MLAHTEESFAVSGGCAYGLGGFEELRRGLNELGRFFCAAVFSFLHCLWMGSVSE